MEIVAFYRSDSTQGMKRVLLRGAGLVTLGALVMVVAFLARQSANLSMAASCAGVVLILAGTLAAVIGLQRILANETCIVVRQDALVVERRGGDAVVAWDDVESIRAADAALVVARRDGTEIRVDDRRFGGKDARTLAAELDGIRRKAAFGLLRG